MSEDEGAQFLMVEEIKYLMLLTAVIILQYNLAHQAGFDIAVRIHGDVGKHNWQARSRHQDSPPTPICSASSPQPEHANQDNIYISKEDNDRSRPLFVP